MVSSMHPFVVIRVNWQFSHQKKHLYTVLSWHTSAYTLTHMKGTFVFAKQIHSQNVTNTKSKGSHVLKFMFSWNTSDPLGWEILDQIIESRKVNNSFLMLTKPWVQNSFSRHCPLFALEQKGITYFIRSSGCWNNSPLQSCIHDWERYCYPWQPAK